MRRPAGRPIAVLAAVVGAALAAAGCAGIPDSGPVVPGERVRQAAPGALLVIPEPPQPGATPEQVLAGFIAAMAQVDAEFGVARQFLTDEAARQWDPRRNILVYSGIIEPSPVVDGRSVATVAVTSEISEAGRYTPRPRTTRVNREFTIAQEDGEWRVSDPEDEALVSEADAQRVLRPYPVYFPAAVPSASGTGRRHLVPDVRWFPAQQGSAEPLAQAVLDGPSPQLVGAVDAVSGPGLALAEEVTVSQTVATVDLTRAYDELDEAEAALLRVQLERTLIALPGVGEVQLSVEGARADGPAAPGDPFRDPPTRSNPHVLLSPLPPDGAVAPPVAPAAVSSAAPSGTAAEVLPDGPVVAVLDDRGSPEPVEGSAAFAAAVEDGLAVDPATSPASVPTLFAGRGDGGTTVYTSTPGQEEPRALITGSGLTAPSPDVHGWTWVGSNGPTPDGAVAAAFKAGDGVVVHALAGRRHVPLDLGSRVEGLSRVLVFRVSRDATRALLVVELATGSHQVLVFGVLRDDTGRPTGLSASPFAPFPDLVVGVDATWVSQDTIAVLGSEGEGGGEAQPFLAQVGGAVTPLARLATAVSIAAGNGERTILVGKSDGTLVSRVGNAWSPEPVSGRSPTY